MNYSNTWSSKEKSCTLLGLELNYWKIKRSFGQRGLRGPTRMGSPNDICPFFFLEKPKMRIWEYWTEYWKDKGWFCGTESVCFWAAPNIQLPGTRSDVLWGCIVFTLADLVLTHIDCFFLNFKRGNTSICIFLLNTCVSVCDSFVYLILSRQGSMSWTMTSPSTLAPDNQLWQGRHTCPRSNEQPRRVKWPRGSTHLSIAGWRPAMRRKRSTFDKLWPGSPRSPVRLIRPGHLDVQAWPETESSVARPLRHRWPTHFLETLFDFKFR